MQTIRVVLTAILLGLFGLARPFVNCSAQPGESLYIRTDDQLNMSNSISTLLLRNLSDVFGENDPVLRIAGRDREAPCVGVMMRLAPSGDVLSRIGRLLEERTIRPDVAAVYALQDASSGLEGHRREPARGSWDVAQWAGSAKTQQTRQDRASCSLDISNE
jgi:hypothetical protein